MESKSNILLLIGPPGTGKTTFIKALLAEMNKRAYLTYDDKVLSNDYTFASYMADDGAGAFVIEDADLFLRSRADGNGMVSRFLNVGDGIIKLRNKKLIFSTNLPKVDDIDPALIRPGRCFDVLHFRNLTRSEATTVADNRNFILPGDESKEEYTLAEVFNNPVEKPAPVSRKFGFC
jgi:SpoVK/Ycf46/Vps4 family AAA+-type ATPase